MNRSNVLARAMQARSVVSNFVQNASSKAAVAGLALSPGFAFASGGTGFDSASIITKITENGETAVLILGALILAAWGLKSMGLLRGRG